MIFSSTNSSTNTTGTASTTDKIQPYRPHNDNQHHQDQRGNDITASKKKSALIIMDIVDITATNWHTNKILDGCA